MGSKCHRSRPFKGSSRRSRVARAGRRGRQGRSTQPLSQAAIADLEREGARVGRDAGPDPGRERDRTDRVPGRDPAAGYGTDDVSNDALATLRDDLCRDTLGKVAGVEYAVTGATAAVAGLQREMSRRCHWSSGSCSSSRSCFCWSRSARSSIALNAISSTSFRWCRLRRPCRRLPVGLGRDPARLRGGGGIVTWLPLFLFVILFGLSMDYHVFILVGSVRPGRGLATEDAIEHGIKSTAGVVTERRDRHGRRLRVFAMAAPRRPEADGRRPRGRRPDRRHHRPRRASSRVDEAARGRRTGTSPRGSTGCPTWSTSARSSRSSRSTPRPLSSRPPT